MATIVPAAGKGSLVKCAGTVIKLATWRRTRTAGDLEFPTTGMTADADGNYETPHAAGLINTTIVIEGPYDGLLPFHNAPYGIRAGVILSFQFGMYATGPVTPASNYEVIETTDENDVAALGRWSATIRPNTDTSAGYFTAVV